MFIDQNLKDDHARFGGAEGNWISICQFEFRPSEPRRRLFRYEL